MREMLQTLLASALIAAGGLASFAAITHDFRVFTTEGARRLAIDEQPRAIPDGELQAADGRLLHLRDLQGQWLLVDFVYTRCLTWCSLQGNDFARLQDRFAGPIRDGRLKLLSISFDPEHDDPEALAAWQQRSMDRGQGWLAARPTNPPELERWLESFQVRAIPDGWGGYVHNAALNVIDPSGHLVRILDWDDTAGATRLLSAELEPDA